MARRKKHGKKGPAAARRGRWHGSARRPGNDAPRPEGPCDPRTVADGRRPHGKGREERANATSSSRARGKRATEERTKTNKGPEDHKKQTETATRARPVPTRLSAFIFSFRPFPFLPSRLGWLCLVAPVCAPPPSPQTTRLPPTKMAEMERSSPRNIYFSTRWGSCCVTRVRVGTRG